MSDTQQKPADTAPKVNIFKRLWLKSGITGFMVLLAIKGALPTVISLSAYRGLPFAEVYTTLGYLIAIISHLSLVIQPRAKYVQGLTVSIFAICLGAALALLEIRCVVAARSTPPASAATGGSGSRETPTYDSSANATAGVFLVVYVFMANVVKSARPQLMIPMIQFSIFVIVASVYAPQFPEMVNGELFVRRLLIAFLTGQAIATAVSLFIMPVTSRGIITKQMGGFTKLLKGCLAAHGAYLAAVRHASDLNGVASDEEKAAGKKLKGTLAATNELLAKMKLELNFASKEMAYGHLRPDHFKEIYKMLRMIYQPVVGMNTFLGIVTTLREQKTQRICDENTKDAIEAVRRLEVEEWDAVVNISQEAYKGYSAALFAGLTHVAYQLRFEKRPKAKLNTDVEKTAGSIPQPGDPEFSAHLEAELVKYQHHRISVIQEWARHKNLSLPNHFWKNVYESPSLHQLQTNLAREKLNQHQLYMILYMNFLNFALGRALLRLVRYADTLYADGTMKRRRFIFPGWIRLRKLFSSALTPSDSDETMGAGANGGSNVFLGDALNNRPKDPEHLPPTNIYERATDLIRKVPHAMNSRHALFGIRASLATISIGIIGFLRQTRPFFLEQRGMWALIMVGISMDPYAGQGLFGFVLRLGGTTFAMVAAITIWYMCDHNVPAILVVFFIYMALWQLFMIKYMQFAMVAMISSVTVVLIIGYELQVSVIGLREAVSNGQVYYPIALLAVYRLAAVAAGLFAAFVWTYFPFPITTHGALRHDLGSSLYILANYYSCVHSTLDARLHLGPKITHLPPSHPVNKLDSARIKVFGKVLLMLNRLHTHAKFSKYEPPFGGKFPRQKYEELIASVQTVFSYMALLEYSSYAFTRTAEELSLSRATTEIQQQIPAQHEPTATQSEESSASTTVATIADDDAWATQFRAFAASSHQRVTSHEITSTLCLLSAAIKTGQPLPPYMSPPKPFAATSARSPGPAATTAGEKRGGEGLGESEGGLLGIEHFAHPAYAAFAVQEVASAFVTAELGRLVKGVRDLVGEVDFSFHVLETGSDREGKGSGGGDGKWWDEQGKGKRE